LQVVIVSLRAIVHATVARRTDRRHKTKMIRAAICESIQMMWLHIRLPVPTKKVPLGRTLHIHQQPFEAHTVEQPHFVVGRFVGARLSEPPEGPAGRPVVEAPLTSDFSILVR
jgi:hypothetical protein